MGCNSTKEATAQKPAAPAEERALAQLKLIFDSIDANQDGSVSKAELIAALVKDTSLGTLVKEAGFNPNYCILEQLRVTWGEFESNLRRAMVLTELTPEEQALTQLKLIFDSIDTNEDGSVSKAELTVALDKDPNLGTLFKEAGFNPNYEVIGRLGTNADGRVTWEEFEASLKQAAVAEVHESGFVAAAELPADEKALQQLRKLFALIDANGDGGISKKELSEGLKKDESVGKLVEEAGFNPEYYILEQLDTNCDGRVTWDEFEAHLRSAAKKEVKERADVVAAVVLEQKKEAELVENANGAVEPKGFWCC